MNFFLHSCNPAILYSSPYARSADRKLWGGKFRRRGTEGIFFECVSGRRMDRRFSFSILHSPFSIHTPSPLRFSLRFHSLVEDASSNAKMRRRRLRRRVAVHRCRVDAGLRTLVVACIRGSHMRKTGYSRVPGRRSVSDESRGVVRAMGRDPCGAYFCSRREILRARAKMAGGCGALLRPGLFAPYASNKLPFFAKATPGKQTTNCKLVTRPHSSG